MKTNLIKQESLRYKVLSEDQIKQIHYATLNVLSRTGARIQCEKALQLLKDAGCNVEKDLVKFPPHLVKWAINSCPEKVFLYDRLGNLRLSLGGYNTYFGLGPTLLNMIDPQTGKRRRFLKEDTVKAAKVVDALPNIDWAMGLGTISNLPHEYSDRHEFEAIIENTIKPIVIWSYTEKGLQDIIEMASAAVGSLEKLIQKPFIVSYSEPISPLTGDEEATKKLLLAAQYGIPIIHTPCPQGGATAPATLAGEIVQANAENLSSLVIAQLKRKGASFFIGGVLTIMDLNTAVMAYGSPEMHLMLSAYMDIAHYYNIPTWGTAGCTDSKIIDGQSAIEATFSCLFSSLSGANLVHDTGYMESGKTGSLEMIVMVNEIIGYIKRIMKGIRVDEETLATEVINDVGPGGDFLTHEHTLKHFREEIWELSLIDRQIYSKWVDSGSKKMSDRIKDKVKYILGNHVPQPLPEKAKKRIREIMNKLR